MDKAEYIFEKLSGFGVSDVENRLGLYLSDRAENKVRKDIAMAKNKSFALRHPVLTGIPTLGIAPAVAKDRAITNISDNLLRRDLKLRKQYRDVVDARRARGIEKYKLETERIKADQASRAAKTLADAYLITKSSS